MPHILIVMAMELHVKNSSKKEASSKLLFYFHKGKITIHDLQFLKCEIACEDCSASVCSIDSRAHDYSSISHQLQTLVVFPKNISFIGCH
jgi:hypothetical protein